jgi:hypothetical protein
MSELVNTSEVAIHPFHYLIGTKRLLTHIFKELAHLLTVQVQQVNFSIFAFLFNPPRATTCNNEAGKNYV